VDRLIADSSFLVAYGKRADTLHNAATAFAKKYSGSLITVGPVVVETCYFFQARGKLELLRWIGAGGLAVVDVPSLSYPDIAATIEKYADRDIDFADAALIWLANETGLRRILIADRRDFSVYRLKGAKRFDLIEWF
jgi:uncharacterized protein